MTLIQNKITLQKACIDRINDVFDTCEQYFNTKFFKPRVVFNLRGNIAGRASYSQNLIKLNAQLLIANGDKFVADTPGHEAAHIVARIMFGCMIRPHGNEWARVMNIINQPANRCHNFEVKTKNVYSCSCPNEKHYLSTRRHNNILKGTHIYRCKNCKQNLVWINFAA